MTITDDDDDEKSIKLDPSPSCNSFSVPEDSDSDSAGPSSNDSSDDSVARSWENTVLQPAIISPISPGSILKCDKHLHVEDKQQKVKDEHAKDQDESLENEPKLLSGYPSPIEPSSNSNIPVMVAPIMAPELPSPMSDTNPISEARPVSEAKPVSDGKAAPTKVASTELLSVQPFIGEDNFPATCYQQIPETHFSNWTMMKPMFMRLADMAWGESNNIPDIDYEKRVIHAARRCSLSTDSYWVDDCPSFKPCSGTEVYWEPDSEESDTSFHRMPGSLLRYWSVDKRRYWIIYEDEDGQKMSNWWYIVEKPLELLSEELKRQLMTETEIDDRHKYWIVRAWEPQKIGGRWCDVAPYWDPDFDENLLSDDDSVDSDDEGLYSEESVSESDDFGESIAEHSGGYENEQFDSEPIHGAKCGVSEAYPQDDGEDGGYEMEGYEEVVDEDEESDESEDDIDYSSEDEHLVYPNPQKHHIRLSLDEEYMKELERAVHTDAVEVSKHVPEHAGRERLYQEALGGQSSNFARDESKPEIAQTAPGMTKPGAQFPAYNVSGELPKSCQNKFPPMKRKIENTIGVPSFSHGYETFYHDGPFSSNAAAVDFFVPDLSRAGKSPLKRTATEMESSSLESDFSQDAQRLPVEPVSQSDIDIISSEAREAISSALAENVPANSENERPTKRVKSDHSFSKTLASHATTAAISALLGGLGTIALLAALPNEYFQ